MSGHCRAGSQYCLHIGGQIVGCAVEYREDKHQHQDGQVIAILQQLIGEDRILRVAFRQHQAISPIVITASSV